MRKLIFATLILATITRFAIGQNTEMKPINIFEPTAQHGLDVYMIPQSSEVTVYIYDASGTMMLAEHVDAFSDLKKRYNLKSLENGQYSFEVESDSWKMVQEFAKKDAKVLFDDEGQAWTDYPDWTIASNAVLLPRQNTNQAPPKEFTVRDQRGNVVYSHDLDAKSFENGVRFDLTKLAAGEYDISLATEQRTFFKSFTKE